MVFRPFGDPIDLWSVASPATIKQRIRSRKKGWFDPKPGARGWIVGPILCLWHSPYDRNGPMLIALLRAEGMGTRIMGRAGSDLNGVAMLIALSGLMAWLAWKMVGQEGLTPGVISMAAIFLLGVPAMLIWAHKDRRSAAPLVRFLQKTVGYESGVSPMEALQLSARRAIRFEIDGEEQAEPLSSATLRTALEELGAKQHLALVASSETYTQVMFDRGDFIVERRDGGAESHRVAVWTDRPGPTTSALPLDWTLQLLIAWVVERPANLPVEWTPLPRARR